MNVVHHDGSHNTTGIFFCKFLILHFPVFFFFLIEINFLLHSFTFIFSLFC